MAERKIVTRIEISGENEYKQAIKNLNSSLKLYNSELSSLKEKYKDAQNSYDYLKQKAEILNKVQVTQKDKVTELSKALENAKKVQENYNQKVEEATKKVQQAESECEKLKNSVGENSDEYKQAKNTLDQYNNELKELQSAQELCGNSVNEWQAKLNSAETQQNRVNSQIEKNNQYLKEAQNSTDGCATSIDNYGKKVKQASDDIGDSSEKLNETNKAYEALTNTIIATGIKSSFEAVYNAISQCVEAADEFESSIAKLQTISGESPISTLTEDILTLSSATGIAASDLANTAYNAISAGTAVSDAVGMAEAASKLAIAGFTDTDSALSVLTTAINAYGDSAGTATEISDSLIQVQNLGVTTVADLAANMGKAIASASAYSVNLSNLEAAYISTTKAGINTAESTTYITSMMKELGDSGSDVSKVIQEKTGQSFGQLMKSGESLGNILQMLLESCNNDSEALMNLWSSAEAGKASNAILNQGIETFNKNLQTVQSSTGATETAYETMADTAEMAGKRASNAFENLKIAIGEQLTPVVTDAQNTFADMTEGFTNFVKENPQVVTAIEAVAVGLGIFAGAVIAVNVAVNVLIPLIQTLTATMEANPMGILITAAGALAGAFLVLASNAEEADGALKDYHDAASTARDASDDLKQSMNEAESTFSDTSGEIGSTASQAATLVEKLESLARKTDKSNDDISEMSTLVDELNTLYPELGLEINKATGELNKTNVELERYIKNARDAALADAYSEKMQEESKAVVEAQTSLASAQDKLSSAKEEYNTLVKQQSEVTEKSNKAVDNENKAFEKYTQTLNDANASIDDIAQAERDYEEAKNDAATATEDLNRFNEEYAGTLADCQDAQEDAKDAIDDANESLENAQDTLDDTTSAYEDYQFKLTDVGDACQGTFDKTLEMLDAMDQSSDVYEDIKGQLEEVTNEHLNLQSATQATYDSLKTQLDEVQAKFDEETSKIKDNLSSQVGGLDAANLEIEYSAQQIADNLKSQADYLSNYMSNVQAITNSNALTMTDEFKSFITSGSEEAVQVAGAMNQALAEGNVTAAQAVIDNYTNVQGTLSSTSTAMADANGNYTSQINNLKTQLNDCVKEMDKRDIAYRNVLNTFQYAINAANGKSTPLINVFSSTSTSAVKELDRSAISRSYAENNISGAIKGASSLVGDYVAVYRNMANAAIAEMKRVDQQKSPSRRYRQHGRYNVQGAILGVKDLSDEYVQAYADMATDAIDAYNNQMEELAPTTNEATEAIFGSSGSINLNASVNNSVGNMIDSLGSAVSSANKASANKLDKVVDLLQRYLPEAGTTYLDGTLISKRVSTLQTLNAKKKSAIQGVK